MLFWKTFLGLYAFSLFTDILWRFYVARRVIALIAEQQRYVLQVEASGDHTPNIHVVLLLPLLREQDNVAPLLAAIDTLTFPTERLLVVPITTEREVVSQRSREQAANSVLNDLEVGRRGVGFLWRHSSHFATHRLQFWAKTFPTEPDTVRAAIQQLVTGTSTQEVVEQLIEKGGFRFRLLHIHYPSHHGNKASQMNYALQVLREQGAIAEPERTYVGVYDADSRPPRPILIALSIAASEDLAAAFQQYPIYLQDTTGLEPLMRNEAWLQTARSVCIELPRQLHINTEIKKGRRNGKTFTYCIGHGEFLRADWLMRAGFPEETPIDDLPTGLMLSLAAQPIVPLPFFDFCGVPNNILDFFRQSATWFEAQSDYIGPYRRAACYFKPLSKRRRFRGLVEQVEANITWAARGPIRIIMLLSSLMTGLWQMSVVLSTLFLAEAWTQWSITQLLLDSHVCCDHLPRWPFAWSSVTRPLFKSVGPCIYLLRKLFGRQVPSYKTER
jgi:cellulose synthase/poly-beta-1,6-N-acetylglucosamine synthase-like glycosyltransferase